MTRLALIAFGALALFAGCNPVVYVPTPIPAAPLRPGLKVGLGGNLAGSQGLALVEFAPGEGMALYARGLYANTLDGGETAGAYIHRGGDLGVIVARPLSRKATLDLGLAAGRDLVDATDSSADTGCCSYSYGPYEASVERFGGHVGLFFHERSEVEDQFRLGPVVRVQAVTVHGEDDRDGTWLMIEPALRAQFGGGPFEVVTQVGLSLPADESFTDQFSLIPLVFGATATLDLSRLGAR